MGAAFGNTMIQPMMDELSPGMPTGTSSGKGGASVAPVEPMNMNYGGTYTYPTPEPLAAPMEYSGGYAPQQFDNSGTIVDPTLSSIQQILARQPMITSPVAMRGAASTASPYSTAPLFMRGSGVSDVSPYVSTPAVKAIPKATASKKVAAAKKTKNPNVQSAADAALGVGFTNGESP